MADYTRSLEAVLEANETITQALRDISNSLREVGADTEAVEQAAESLENTTDELAQSMKVGEQAAEGEGAGFRKAAQSAKALDNAKESVTLSNEELAMAAEATEKAIDDEAMTMLQAGKAADSLETFITRLNRQNLQTSVSTEELREELGDVSWQAKELTPALAQAIMAIKGTGQAADEAADDVRELDYSMKSLGATSIATSLDLGPFNVSLENIFATITQLILVIGPLIAALGGLAAAALNAAMALSMIFGGGLLVMAESIEATSADIEDRLEAMEEILSELGELFAQALEPLQNEASVRMFRNAVTGLAEAFNYVAQAIAYMQDFFEEFQNSLGEIFWDRIDHWVDATANLLHNLMPTLEAIFDWFMVAIPNAFNFMAEEGDDLYSVLGDLMRTLTDLASTMIEFGNSIFKGALPAVGAVLEAIDGVVEIFNTLPDEIWAAVAALGAITVIGNKVVGVFDILGSNVGTFYKVLNDATGSVAKFHDALRVMKLNNFALMVEKLAEKYGALDKLAAGSVVGLTEDMQDAVENADEIDDYLTPLANLDFSDAKKSAKDFFNQFKGASPVVQNMEGGLFKFDESSYAVPSVTENLKQIRSNIGKRARSIFSEGSLLGDLRLFGSGFKDILLGKEVDELSDAVREASERVGDRLQTVISPFKKLGGAARNAADGVMSAGGSLLDVSRNALKAAGGVWSTVSSFILMEARAITAAFAQQGLAGGLKQVAMSAFSAVTSVVAYTTSLIGGLIPAVNSSTVSVWGLSTALDAIGIGLIIKGFVALVAVAAALAGIIANLNVITETATGIFEYLKEIAYTLFDVLMQIGVPVWNALVDVFELIGAFIFPVADGLGMVAEAMGLAGEEGSSLSSVMSFLASIGGVLSKLWSGLWGTFGGLFDIVGDFISLGIRSIFRGIAIVVEFLISVLTHLIDTFTEMLVANSVVTAIRDAFATFMDWLTGWGEAFADAFSVVVDVIESAVNFGVDLLNGFIQGLNKVPGVNIDTIDSVSLGGQSDFFSGAQTSMEEVRENAGTASAEDKVAGGQTNITNNITKNEYTFGDFTMLPEEKARVKGMVKDALREANRNERLEGGHIG